MQLKPTTSPIPPSSSSTLASAALRPSNLPPLNQAEQKELDTWKERLQPDLGLLQTPPIGSSTPDLTPAKNYVESVLNQVAGDDLKQRGLNVRVELFSGDIPQAALDGDGFQEKVWTKNHPDRPWPIRTWFGVPQDGKPIYRLVVNEGLLRTLNSRDELGFVLAQQAEQLLAHDKADPANEDAPYANGQSVVEPHKMQMGADRDAVQRMAEHGLNPGGALRALDRLFAQRPPEYSVDDGPRALQAAAAGHEQEGLRVALVQTEVEQLKRSGHPSTAKELEPLPGGLVPTGPSLYEKTVQNFSAFQANLSKLADGLGGDQTPAWMFGVATKPPEMRALQDETASREDFERALLGTLDHLNSSNKTEQFKVNAFLRVLLAFKGDCLPDDKPVSAETLSKLSAGLATSPGWNAAPFLASLKRGERSLYRNFARTVQLNPHFQTLAAPLTGPQGQQGWTDLAASAPLNYARDPETSAFTWDKFCSFYTKNQNEGKDNQALAATYNQAVRSYVAAQNPAALASQEDERGVPRATSLTNRLLTTPRLAPVEHETLRKSLQPLLEAGQGVRETHARLRLRPPVAQPEKLDNYLNELFRSEEWGGFSGEFSRDLPTLLLDVARTASSQPDMVTAPGKPTRFEPTLEKRLCESLLSSQDPADRKAVLRTLARHWESDRRIPATSPRRAWTEKAAATLDGPELVELLTKPDLSQHSAVLKQTFTTGWQLKPDDIPDVTTPTLDKLNERAGHKEFEPKKDDYATEGEYMQAMAEYSRRLSTMAAAIPFLATAEARLNLGLLSMLGHDEKLSSTVAGKLDPASFDSILGAAEEAKHRSETIKELGQDMGDENVGSDAGAFLLDGFLAVEGKIQDLDSWYSSFNRTLTVSPGIEEARSGTRKKLSASLAPRLAKLEPPAIQTWLDKKHVLENLTATDASNLIMQTLGDACAPGADPKKLASMVGDLDTKMKLRAEHPAVFSQLRNQIAETARLQPGTVDLVFPPDERSGSEATATFKNQMRGLSGMLAITRGRPSGEQIDTVEYMLGRRKTMPTYLEDASEGQNFAPIAQEIRNVRESMIDADPMERAILANSFLAGPNGLMRSVEGRQAMIDHFMKGIPEKSQELARKVANAVLESQGDADTLAVAFLLAQPPKKKKADGSEDVEQLDMAAILSRLFDSYGVPGIKMKQYLAFTSEFEPFKEAFESAQDAAMPLNHYQTLKLIQGRFGDDWPKDLKVERTLGSGSVNVAIRYKNQKTGKNEVVSLGREDIEETTAYDFKRFTKFLEALTRTPEDKDKFGYALGLMDLIRSSVKLEFDKEAAMKVQKMAFKSYQRKFEGYTVRSIDAHKVAHLGLFMEEAKGRTARKIALENPALYKDAMRRMATVEVGMLRGQTNSGNWWPKATFANPDFHDGQVLIDEPNKTVTILDFGQAVPIDNAQRETALDLLTVIGKGDSAEAATKRLNKRFFKDKPGLTVDDLQDIMKRKDRMDCFIHLLSLISQHGSEVPISAVHWVLGLNRQIALGEKLGQSIHGQVRNMVINHKIGLPLGVYNVAHEAKGIAVRIGTALSHCLGAWAVPKDPMPSMNETVPENQSAPEPKEESWAWRPEQTFLAP